MVTTSTPSPGGEFSRGKTIVVLAVVVGCFAILWPKVFYPMFTASILPSGDPDEVCCDVISERDTNAYKIMTEICSNIIRQDGKVADTGQGRPIPKPQEQAPSKIRRPTAILCRNEILKNCGVDILILLQENAAITKEYKESLGQLRSFNTSHCMKINYGVDFGEIGLPHHIKGPFSHPSHMRPERPLRPDMLHPALREKGRAIPSAPRRTIEREARPGPVPGVRPPVGGAGHIPNAPKGSGTMGIIMPMYTIGIVCFFVYTLLKILFKKTPEESNVVPQPILKDFGMDPEHRKFVFSEEYAEGSDKSIKEAYNKEDRDLGVRRKSSGGKGRFHEDKRRLELETEPGTDIPDESEPNLLESKSIEQGSKAEPKLSMSVEVPQETYQQQQKQQKQQQQQIVQPQETSEEQKEERNNTSFPERMTETNEALEILQEQIIEPKVAAKEHIDKYSATPAEQIVKPADNFQEQTEDVLLTEQKHENQQILEPIEKPEALLSEQTVALQEQKEEPALASQEPIIQLEEALKDQIQPPQLVLQEQVDEPKESIVKPKVALHDHIAQTLKQQIEAPTVTSQSQEQIEVALEPSEEAKIIEPEPQPEIIEHSHSENEAKIIEPSSMKPQLESLPSLPEINEQSPAEIKEPIPTSISEPTDRTKSSDDSTNENASSEETPVIISSVKETTVEVQQTIDPPVDVVGIVTPEDLTSAALFFDQTFEDDEEVSFDQTTKPVDEEVPKPIAPEVVEFANNLANETLEGAISTVVAAAKLLQPKAEDQPQLPQNESLPNTTDSIPSNSLIPDACEPSQTEIGPKVDTASNNKLNTTTPSEIADSRVPIEISVKLEEVSDGDNQSQSNINVAPASMSNIPELGHSSNPDLGNVKTLKIPEEKAPELDFVQKPESQHPTPVVTLVDDQRKGSEPILSRKKLDVQITPIENISGSNIFSDMLGGYVTMVDETGSSLPKDFLRKLKSGVEITSFDEPIEETAGESLTDSESQSRRVMSMDSNDSIVTVKESELASPSDIKDEELQEESSSDILEEKVGEKAPEPKIIAEFSCEPEAHISNQELSSGKMQLEFEPIQEFEIQAALNKFATWDAKGPEGHTGPALESFEAELGKTSDINPVTKQENSVSSNITTLVEESPTPIVEPIPVPEAKSVSFTTSFHIEPQSNISQETGPQILQTIECLDEEDTDFPEETLAEEIVSDICQAAQEAVAQADFKRMDVATNQEPDPLEERAGNYRQSSSFSIELEPIIHNDIQKPPMSEEIVPAHEPEVVTTEQIETEFIPEAEPLSVPPIESSTSPLQVVAVVNVASEAVAVSEMQKEDKPVETPEPETPATTFNTPHTHNELEDKLSAKPTELLGDVQEVSIDQPSVTPEPLLTREKAKPVVASEPSSSVAKAGVVVVGNEGQKGVSEAGNGARKEESGTRDRDARDIEIDMLRKRLEETEAAMERIVAQMGTVSDRLSPSILAQVLKAQGVRQEDLERRKDSEPTSSLKSTETKDSKPKSVKSQSSVEKEVKFQLPPKDSTTEEEEEEEEEEEVVRPPTPPRTLSKKSKHRSDSSVLSTFAQELSETLLQQGAAAAIAAAKASGPGGHRETVSVVGIEETAELRSGDKWDDRTPTPTFRMPTPPVPHHHRAPTPPENIPSIFLEGPMPSLGQQLIVSDQISEVEGDYPDDDFDQISNPIVLSGKVTLSVISGGGHDDLTDASSLSYDDRAQAGSKKAQSGSTNKKDGLAIKTEKGLSSGKKPSPASSPDMEDYEVIKKDGFSYDEDNDDVDITSYMTAETDGEAGQHKEEDTAGDLSEMDGLDGKDLPHDNRDEE